MTQQDDSSSASRDFSPDQRARLIALMKEEIGRVVDRALREGVSREDVEAELRQKAEAVRAMTNPQE